MANAGIASYISHRLLKPLCVVLQSQSHSSLIKGLILANAAAMSLSSTHSAELQLPKPPSAETTKSDCAATLAWLETSIATIYSAAKTTPPHEKRTSLARDSYLHLYTATHDYCMLTKHLHKTQPNDPPNCEDLYLSLRNEIGTHCSEIQAHVSSSETHTGVDSARRTIGEYLAQWDRFTHLAVFVSHVLHPLEKEWIQRVVMEGKKDMCLIKDLHTLVWKAEVLRVGVDSNEVATESEIAQAVATLQKNGEGKDESDDALFARLSESIGAIGLEARHVR